MSAPIPLFEEAQKRMENLEKAPLYDNSLKNGGGGGNTVDMHERVTRLEATIEFVRKDLEEIKSANKEILRSLPTLASKGTVWTALGTGGGIAVAILGIFIAILTYLQAIGYPANPSW